MQALNQNKTTNNLTKPGDQLLMELTERGLSQKDLADAIDKPTPLINEIIRGNRRFSAEMSTLVGAALDMAADYWLNLQVQYEISLVELEDQFNHRIQSIKDWNRLKETLNVGYLKKKFDLSNDTAECVNRVFRYFGVSSIQEFDQKADRVCDAYFRKSEKNQTDAANLLTWTMVAKHDSEEYNGSISKFDKRKEQQLVSDLNKVFLQNTDTINKTSVTLCKYGIKFLREEILTKVPVDGYSFWIGNNPTIVMTTRFDRIDNFAFTLMHEVGHVFKHLSPSRINDSIDIYINEDRETVEREANDYATKCLLGNAPIEELFARCKNPYTAENRIIEFAKAYSIHPSIVAGQYRNHFNSYSACSKLIDKIG